MSNFWRSFDLPLINCEIELDLQWWKERIISEISIINAVPGDPNAYPPVLDVAAKQITSATFPINNAILYVLVITFSNNDSIKFLENIKQEFERKISWDKYRSEITTQPTNNNLDCLIDPIFRNINRLFVFSFKNGIDAPTRNSFNKYYMALAGTKDSNALIDNKPFLGQSVKYKQEAFQKLMEMSRNTG